MNVENDMRSRRLRDECESKAAKLISKATAFVGILELRRS